MRRCINCRERFSETLRHVAYGGGVFCTEECLATYVVYNDIEVEKVQQEFEVRNAD